MKKSNFTYKTLILMLTILTYSFTTKTNNINNQKLSDKTENILIVYPPYLDSETKIEMRSNFLNSIGLILLNYTQCSQNANAEILTVYLDSNSPTTRPTRDGTVDDTEDNEHPDPSENNNNPPSTILMTHAFMNGLLYATVSNNCSTGDLDFNIGR